MYYRELNFPPIPEELLQEEFIPESGHNDIGYGAEHFKNNNKLEPCSYWISSVKNKKLYSWIWKNVPVTKLLTKFNFQQTHHETGGYHIVHSDILRSYAINYMIELGGDEVCTSWYKENGQPLRRLKIAGNTQSDRGYIDYKNLELLDSVKLEQGKWYIIATDILHDVGKIVGTRKSITISIPPHLERKTLETLKLC
jgi:hypothetical protein